MSNLSPVREDLRAAEVRVREALAYHTSGSRLEALLQTYRVTPISQRDALFAAVAAHLTLIPPAEASAHGVAP